MKTLAELLAEGREAARADRLAAWYQGLPADERELLERTMRAALDAARRLAELFASWIADPRSGLVGAVADLVESLPQELQDLREPSGASLTQALGRFDESRRYEFRWEHLASRQTVPHGKWWAYRVTSTPPAKVLPVAVALTLKRKGATFLDFYHRRPRPRELAAVLMHHRCLPCSEDEATTLMRALRRYGRAFTSRWRPSGRLRVKVRDADAVALLDILWVRSLSMSKSSLDDLWEPCGLGTS